jgi:hypothetical protein
MSPIVSGPASIPPPEKTPTSAQIQRVLRTFKKALATKGLWGGVRDPVTISQEGREQAAKIDQAKNPERQ